MKKLFAALTILLLLLAGCSGTKTYSFSDGRYAIESSVIPYLLIGEGRFTIVKDVAISYQPDGVVRQDGNAVVLEGKYHDAEYCYTFTLTADDTLRFDLGRSNILQSDSEWTDGMTFTPATDETTRYGITDKSQMNADQIALMNRYPAYFGLDASEGLDVIVWQTAQDNYAFGLLEHTETPRERIDSALMALKGVSAKQMRTILSTYTVENEDVYIIPWQNPYSSYLGEYWANLDGEEDLTAKREAYIVRVREMLFSAEMNADQIALMDRYPAYFGLNVSGGLDVIVWQTAQDNYAFGLLEHTETPRERIDSALMALKGVSAKQMRTILSTYTVENEDVYIIPWQNPYSSYMGEYWFTLDGEETTDAEKETYIARVREMLFGTQE